MNLLQACQITLGTTYPWKVSEFHPLLILIKEHKSFTRSSLLWKAVLPAGQVQFGA